MKIIQEIKFFDTSQACIAGFGTHSWIKSHIQSWGTFFGYLLHKVNLVFRRVEREMEVYSAPRSFEGKKLVVCIHGLNNNPSQFKGIVDELEDRSNLFIPKVLNRGNATLDEMVDDIFQKIKPWLTNTGEELVLVGVSNGGRILRALDAKISSEDVKIKKLRSVSIVSACEGSTLATLANKLRLSLLMSNNIAKEMPTDSERTKQLQKDWKKGLSKFERENTFIASPHDWQVPNYESTLSDVPNSRYAIIPGHGHNSIVNACAKAVAEIIN